MLRPFDHGADLVFHSATKFLCGHGIAIGGLLVDGGTFDWQAADEQSGRFAELCEPYEGFHGMVFADESTVAPFALRARREGLRDFGAVMSPHNAFAVLQGIETLSLRMDRHIANTRKVVEFLRTNPPSNRCRIRNSTRIPITNWRRRCCRKAAERCSPSVSRATARPAAASSRR